jgi:hypothetical protein
MSFRFNLLLNQVKKASELIGRLLTSEKLTLREEDEINQNLAELTGFGREFFAGEANASTLPSILLMTDDENKKAVVTMLLLFKDPDLYEDSCLDVLEALDLNKVTPEVRSLVEQVLA